MKVLHGYKSYQIPRKGLFRVSKPDGKYINSQWETMDVEETIIGETSDCYIYRLKPYTEGNWVGNRVITREYILPLGIHKTRLLCWISGQLTLPFYQTKQINR